MDAALDIQYLLALKQAASNKIEKQDLVVGGRFTTS